MRSLFLGVFLFFMSFGSVAYGAELSLRGSQSTLAVGDVISVDVVLNTQETEVNAVAVDLGAPSFLRFLRAEDKDSIISFWIQQPAYDGEVFSLEGIVPGGINIKHGHISRLYFEVISEGQGPITVARARVLAHDGMGTQIETTTHGIHLAVLSGTQAGTPRSFVDDEKPEPFILEVITDPDVHDGAPSLLFQAHDKLSGVRYYKVREGLFGPFIDAESPYVLVHTPGKKQIVVRAYDDAGNYTDAILYPHPLGGFVEYLVPFSSILMVLVLVCLLLFTNFVQRFLLLLRSLFL
jgi:hypothetical protein